jgi:hypothetical protein
MTNDAYRSKRLLAGAQGDPLSQQSAVEIANRSYSAYKRVMLGDDILPCRAITKHCRRPAVVTCVAPFCGALATSQALRSRLPGSPRRLAVGASSARSWACLQGFLPVTCQP